MKHFIITVLFAACLTFGNKANAQAEAEKLNLPGDNLNLYAALKLFQESPTLEGFEKSLNADSSKINNLDLNGDKKVDYIRVVDSLQGDVHNIILKIAVNKNTDQDVAFFVVKKDKSGKAQIQVIGDEDLYGKDYIIEPANQSAGSTPNPGYQGNKTSSGDNSTAVQENAAPGYAPAPEVSSWPVISNMYSPSYVNWQSPWYWDNYPSYWQPWQPYYWHYYYGYNYYWNYYYNTHYRRWHNYRFPVWREQYYGNGFVSGSGYVQSGINQGNYLATYSRPALATQGSALFKQRYPTAPSVNQPLPVFDKTGSPVINRPATTNAVSTSPLNTKQVLTNGAKTVIQPGATEPIPGNAPVTKPDVSKPTVTPVVSEAGTKPVTANPITTRPVLAEPGTQPIVKPGVNEPVLNTPVNKVPVKPVVTDAATKPVINPVANEPIAKPVVKPATTVPVIAPATKPAESQPVVRPPAPVQVRPAPVQPVNRTPNNRPTVTRPVNEPRPAAERPVFTRPQASPQPVQRSPRPKE